MKSLTSNLNIYLYILSIFPLLLTPWIGPTLGVALCVIIIVVSSVMTIRHYLNVGVSAPALKVRAIGNNGYLLAPNGERGIDSDLFFAYVRRLFVDRASTTRDSAEAFVGTRLYSLQSEEWSAARDILLFVGAASEVPRQGGKAGFVVNRAMSYPNVLRAVRDSIQHVSPTPPPSM